MESVLLLQFLASQLSMEREPHLYLSASPFRMGWYNDQPICQQQLQQYLGQAWMAHQQWGIVKSAGRSTMGTFHWMMWPVYWIQKLCGDLPSIYFTWWSIPNIVLSRSLIRTIMARPA
jgi:hypothetical protein